MGSKMVKWDMKLAGRFAGKRRSSTDCNYIELLKRVAFNFMLKPFAGFDVSNWMNAMHIIAHLYYLMQLPCKRVHVSLSLSHTSAHTHTYLESENCAGHLLDSLDRGPELSGIGTMIHNATIDAM